MNEKDKMSDRLHPYDDKILHKYIDEAIEMIERELEQLRLFREDCKPTKHFKKKKDI